VIASWLLDLTAGALVEDPNLSNFVGRVLTRRSWTIKAAIDEYEQHMVSLPRAGRRITNARRCRHPTGLATISLEQIWTWETKMR
jgi:6-phosphogluconate dehydrogenase (decarboxylating)